MSHRMNRLNVASLWFLVFLLWVALDAAAQQRGRLDHAGSRKPPQVFPPLEEPGDPLPVLGAKANPSARSFPLLIQRGPYRSVQVNVDDKGLNIMGDAANEPSITVDPTDPDKMAIGWRQFDTISSNFRQAGWAYSQNGGKKWTAPGVLEPGVFRSDPVLQADAEGNFYYLSLKVDGSIWECGLFISGDGGATWSTKNFAYGGDKSWFTIDRTGGPGHGHLYQAWNIAGNMYYPDQFSRSTNGGTQWGNLSQIPDQPVFGTVAVGPDGELYIAGVPNSYYTDEFYVVKSTNAKDPLANPTFPQHVQVNMNGYFTLYDGPNPDGLLGMVWIAVNHSPGPMRGDVYLLSGVDPTGPDPMNLHFSRSTDGGLTWSFPVRINDDPLGNNAWQWFSTMDVAPNGRIDAIWNDTRESGLQNISTLFYAYSFDGGLTWSENIPVSPPFNSHLGWPNQNKLGDYYDMVSDDTGAGIAYAATFNGEQDVYYLRVFPQ